MPATYTLIASNTLTTSAASVTFSAIPGTYTDLVLKVSARCDFAASDVRTFVTLNSLTTNYSDTFVSGEGSSASSDRYSSNSKFEALRVNGTTSTSSTFTNDEIYIPNYAVTSAHPLSMAGVMENNSATVNKVRGIASLQSTSAAITSIKLEAQLSNFVAGSSFFLYGIKNS